MTTAAPVEQPGQSSPTRVNGLGTLAKLTDTILVSILGHVDAKSLACKIPLVSKAFYIFANFDELWKDLTISERRGDFKFIGGSWKKTYARKLFDFAQIKIEGFLSEYLNFRYYMSVYDARNLEVADSPEVTRVKAKKLSMEAFKNQFDSLAKICVFNDIVPKWPAAKKWTKENFLKKYGDVKFKVGVKTSTDMIEMTMSDYLQYTADQHEDHPLYLFDNHFGEKSDELVSDYEVPKYFREDLLGLLGERRPNYRWIIIGPGRSGSGWHVDPHGTSAWNALISGRKRWAFYPPDSPPPHGVYLDEDDEFSSPKPLEWFLYFYPQIPAEHRPIEFIQRPGDLVFVPRGWWHLVVNLEDTIAVTQNFINGFNLEKCLEELVYDDRIRYFDTLVKRITATRPEYAELVKAAEIRIRTEMEEESRRDGFDYVKAATEILERHNLQNFAGKESARPEKAHRSENLVIMFGPYVLKFYSVAHGADRSYEKEVDVYDRLASIDKAALEAHGFKSPPWPTLLAKGTYSQERVCRAEDSDSESESEDEEEEPLEEPKHRPLINRRGGRGRGGGGAMMGGPPPPRRVVRPAAPSTRNPKAGADKPLVTKEENGKTAEDATSKEPEKVFDHWLYVVVDRIEGDCIGEDHEHVKDSALLKMANFCGRAVHLIHSVRITKPISDTAHLSVARWHERLLERYDELEKRHEKFSTVSRSMLNQMRAYLPPRDKLIATLTEGAIAHDALLHSDLNDENVLGTLQDIEHAKNLLQGISPKQNNNTSAPSPAGSKKEQDEKFSDWVPSALIDFGDAKAGDPLWDLIPLYASVFRCKKSLLMEFLRAYGDGILLKQPKFSYRCMCYVLLHDCDATASVFDWRPQLRMLDSWEKMCTELWENLDAPDYDKVSPAPVEKK